MHSQQFFMIISVSSQPLLTTLIIGIWIFEEKVPIHFELFVFSVQTYALTHFILFYSCIFTSVFLWGRVLPFI